MATARLPLANLFTSLQALAAWLARRSAPAPRAAVRVPVREAAARGRSRPLRVVRVMEPAAARTAAGRMVISGCMADVCAELDRLAALESRGH